MFESLSDRLTGALTGLRGKGKLTEADINATAREIRLALLEADVSLPVVRGFIKRIKERAAGVEVSEALNPAQQVVKIVNEELVEILGGETRRMTLAKTPPTVIMLAGLQGAGKTTLIKKLIKESFAGQKVVLIENEFGEIGIDGGFLKESGIQINELNAGCICCSLVGDFRTALQQVVEQYHPDRILIEPSGVGKLSDVTRAVEGVAEHLDVQLNSFVTVADVNKVKMYMKNFGEFYDDQISHASCILLSRTQTASEEKIAAAVAMLREKNPTATIVTTAWDELTGEQILKAMSTKDDFKAELIAMAAKANEEHAHEDEEEEHEHHHHHYDENGVCSCGHHHDHDDEQRGPHQAGSPTEHRARTQLGTGDVGHRQHQPQLPPHVTTDGEDEERTEVGRGVHHLRHRRGMEEVPGEHRRERHDEEHACARPENAVVERDDADEQQHQPAPPPSHRGRRIRGAEARPQGHEGTHGEHEDDDEGAEEGGVDN